MPVDKQGMKLTVGIYSRWKKSVEIMERKEGQVNYMYLTSAVSDVWYIVFLPAFIPAHIHTYIPTYMQNLYTVHTCTHQVWQGLNLTNEWALFS